MEFQEINIDQTQEGIKDLQNILADFGNNILKEKIDDIIGKYKEAIGGSILDKGEWINDFYVLLNEKGQSDGWWALKKFKDFCQKRFNLEADHAAVGDQPWGRTELPTVRLRVNEIEEKIKTAMEKKSKDERLTESENVFLSLSERGLIPSIEERVRKMEEYFNQRGGSTNRTLYVVHPCILHQGDPVQSAVLLYG